VGHNSVCDGGNSTGRRVVDEGAAMKDREGKKRSSSKEGFADQFMDFLEEATS